MAKYHVNPNTGVPGTCGATVGTCPFGEELHGDSRASAVAASEKAMKDQYTSTAPTVNRSANRQSVDALRSAQADEVAKRAEYKTQQKGTREDRIASWQEVVKAKAAVAEELKALEDAGMGHLIPDNGPTLRVATRAQAILLRDELSGQISDGKWENLELRDWQNGGKAHWEVWGSAIVIVDPSHVGRNFNAAKDNYQINAKDLLDVVGDRMVEYVKDGTGDKDFNDAAMRVELRELRNIMKTSRNDHTQAAAETSPSGAQVVDRPKKAKKEAKAVAASPAAPPMPTPPPGGYTDSYGKNTGRNGDSSMVGVAMGGAGRAKAPTTYYGSHSGMANPVSGDGDDFGHVSSGNVVILGKADGSRARVMAGAGEFFKEPAYELGRPVELMKQQNSGKDSSTNGLYVLGYRDSKGNSYGYVPDKKLQYFVFK